MNVLAVSQARDTAGKLAGKILNVPGMNRVGTSQVLCPFPCDVLAMYKPGTLALAPSERVILALGEDSSTNTGRRVAEGIMANEARVVM